MARQSVSMRDLFQNWYANSANKGATVWSSSFDWGDPKSLGLVLEQLENEAEAHWSGSSDDLTGVAATIIADVYHLEQVANHSIPADQLHYLRFFLAELVLHHGISRGRASLAFDWLLCSIASRPFEHVESGVAQSVEFHVERLTQFSASRHEYVRHTAPLSVLRWLTSLYYYSRKFGGHRELAGFVLPEARSIVVKYLSQGDESLNILAITAASMLASWAEQGRSDEAKVIARRLAELHGETQSADVRKLICMTLATVIGRHTERPPCAWAKRLLADHADQLAQHEHIQYLIASCETPGERELHHAEIVDRIETFIAELTVDVDKDRIAAEFRALQLFDILAPHIVHLLERGRCQACIELVAAWFNVPKCRRRISPVLCAMPSHGQGALYAVEGRSVVIERDTADALTRVITAINHSFDTNIVVRDNHAFEAHQRNGRWENGRGVAEELLEALEGYYELERATSVFNEMPTSLTGVFQPNAVSAPFQAMTLKRYGSTWPSIASYEEPEADRLIRKVLIWTCGTNFSGYEGRAVASLFRDAGIECETRIEECINQEQFLRFYLDETFDVIWIHGHGQFEPSQPHKAHIELSVDKSQTITLADLIRHRPVNCGRRLLFLNICLGGAIFGIEAPPRFGLGAMVAAANQAVVSHLWEVSSFAAPLFGALAASRLARGDRYFPAFCFATDHLRADREASLQLLREVTGNSESAVELLERIEQGPFGVDPADIRTWGTPVFYE